jgi:hypothetical protein
MTSISRLRKSITRIPVVLVLALSVLTASATLRPAHAVYIPPCEAWECPAGGAVWWSLHGTIVLAGLALFEYAFSLLINQVTDTITRSGNSYAQLSQAENSSGTAGGEQQSITSLGGAVGQQRSLASMSFTPSVTACNLVSNRNAILDETNAVRNQLRQAESKYSALYSNDPSTPAGTGQIGYLSDRFDTRMTRYCNGTTLFSPTGTPPSGLSCTATMGVDLDLKPAEAIFQKVKFTSNAATHPEYVTAQDVVLNLVGNNVSDPVRNQALERPDGRSLALTRYSEQAKLNLASGALLAMVERRRSAWQEATRKATFSDASMDKLAESSSREASSQSMDNVAILFGESSKQLLTLYTFMEQWAAIKAVSLGIDVQENSAKGGTSAGSVSTRQ